MNQHLGGPKAMYEPLDHQGIRWLPSRYASQSLSTTESVLIDCYQSVPKSTILIAYCNDITVVVELFKSWSSKTTGLSIRWIRSSVEDESAEFLQCKLNNRKRTGEIFGTICRCWWPSLVVVLIVLLYWLILENYKWPIIVPFDSMLPSPSKCIIGLGILGTVKRCYKLWPLSSWEPPVWLLDHHTRITRSLTLYPELSTCVNHKIYDAAGPNIPNINAV